MLSCWLACFFSWDVLATPSLECHTELLKPCQLSRVLKPSVQYMFRPMHSPGICFPFSPFQWVPNFRDQRKRHDRTWVWPAVSLDGTARPDCRQHLPSVLMSQQPGQLQHPLGLVPTCLLTPWFLKAEQGQHQRSGCWKDDLQIRNLVQSCLCWERVFCEPPASRT